MADRSIADQLTKYLTDVHSIEVQALAQLEAATSEPAERGDIFDSSGTVVLATTRYRDALAAYADQIPAARVKPLAAALADRDRIYALIRGSATNQDGRTNGLMGASRWAQEAANAPRWCWPSGCRLWAKPRRSSRITVINPSLPGSHGPRG